MLLYVIDIGCGPDKCLRSSRCVILCSLPDIQGKRWMEPVCLAGNLIMAPLFIKKMYNFTVNIKWFTHQRMTESFYWLCWSCCAWENDDNGNHCFCGLLRLANWITVCTNCIFVTMTFYALLLSASPFLLILSSLSPTCLWMWLQWQSDNSRPASGSHRAFIMTDCIM